MLESRGIPGDGRRGGVSLELLVVKGKDSVLSPAVNDMINTECWCSTPAGHRKALVWGSVYPTAMTMDRRRSLVGSDAGQMKWTASLSEKTQSSGIRRYACGAPVLVCSAQVGSPKLVQDDA